MKLKNLFSVGIFLMLFGFSLHGMEEGCSGDWGLVGEFPCCTGVPLEPHLVPMELLKKSVNGTDVLHGYGLTEQDSCFTKSGAIKICNFKYYDE